jgi:hypothetical protein
MDRLFLISAEIKKKAQRVEEDELPVLSDDLTDQGVGERVKKGFNLPESDPCEDLESHRRFL